MYGSSFFFVEPQMNVDLPDEVFLAVNPKGILIINPDSKEVLATHPYSEVPTWGHSSTSFVLHIGNLVKQTKLYFATPNGREINDLVRGRGVVACVALPRVVQWEGPMLPNPHRRTKPPPPTPQVRSYVNHLVTGA